MHMNIDRIKESMLGVTSPKDQWKLLMMELIEFHKEKHPTEELTEEKMRELIGRAMEMMVREGVVQIDEDGKFIVPHIDIMTDA